MKPAIAFLEKFKTENGRVAGQDELQRWADGNGQQYWFVVRDAAYPYSVTHGASEDNDYMVGIWRAEWFHYYKSWDRQFINADDENL